MTRVLLKLNKAINENAISATLKNLWQGEVFLDEGKVDMFAVMQKLVQ